MVNEDKLDGFLKACSKFFSLSFGTLSTHAKINRSVHFFSNFLKLFIATSLSITISYAAQQPVANQQFVMAAPSQNAQPTLQQPFAQNNNNSTNGNGPNPNLASPQNNEQNNPQQNPMNIYVPPNSDQQSPQNNYQAENNPDDQQNYPQQNRTYQNNPSQPSNLSNGQYSENNGDQWQSAPSEQERQNYPSYPPNSTFNQQTPTSQPNQQPYPSPTNNDHPIYQNASENPSNNVPNEQTQIQEPTTVPSNSNNSPFNAKARAEWFKSCMSAITSKKIKASAKAFCTCGWNKISGGGIDPKLLISTNPADIQKANEILNQISQSCLLEIVQGK